MVFDSLDADRSGTLEYKELNKQLRVVRPPFSSPRPRGHGTALPTRTARRHCGPRARPIESRHTDRDTDRYAGWAQMIEF